MRQRISQIFCAVLGSSIAVLFAFPISAAALCSPVAQGGTGWCNITSNTVLYGKGTGALGTTTTGSNGQFLSLVGGIPTWATVSSGTISTSSALVSGQGVYATGASTIASVATSTPSVSGPITYSGTFGSFFGGSSGSFGCTAASGSANGCLSSTDWTTFNNKQAALTFSTGLNNTGGTVTNTGVTSNIAGTGIGVSGATGAVTISNTGVTSIVAGTNVTISGSTGAVTVNSTASGIGNVSTSTGETAGFLPYWTTTNATPALLGKVATTTHSFVGPFSITGVIGALVGGSNSTVNWTGLATTSQPSSSNLLVSNGGSGVYGVATGTVAQSGPITVTAGQSVIGSGLTIGCATCNTSNATVSSIATTYPITGGPITTTGTLALAFGTTTSNTWAGTQTFTNPIVVGAGTSTFGALQGTYLNLTGTTATSTIGNGFSIANGCYAIAGTCIGGGSSLTGTTGQVAYFSGTNTAVGTSSISIGTNQKVQIGQGFTAFLQLGGTNSSFAGLSAANSSQLTVRTADDAFYAPVNAGDFYANPSVGSGAGYFQTGATGQFAFTSAANTPQGTKDTILSRQSPGVVQFGTTAANALGSFLAASSTISGVGSFGTVKIPSLGIAAGQFAAYDPSGNLIATSTPSGSNSAFSPSANYASTSTLPAYTYAAGVITAVGNGAFYLDGNNPSVGQRVLIKNETGSCTSSSGACNNGLYDVTTAGSVIAAFVLTRDAQYNSSSNVIPGIITYVISGTANADDFWAMTSAAPITVGTTALNYVEVSGGGASVTSVSNSDGTLTISPTTGAVVASLALTHANSWTGLQQFSNATSTLFSATTGWVGTLNLTNALGISSGGTNATSFGTSNGIVSYNGTSLVNFANFTLTSSLLTATNASTTNISVNGNEMSGERYPVWGYATSTAWVASSTIPLIAPFKGTLNDIQCATDVGTLNVQLTINSTNVTPMFNASTTKGTVTFTGSNTFVRGDTLNLTAGTPASSPTTINCTGRAVGY